MASNAKPRRPSTHIGMMARILALSLWIALAVGVGLPALASPSVSRALVLLPRVASGCLPHPRGAREAGEHGFGGGTHGEAVRVGASRDTDGLYSGAKGLVSYAVHRDFNGKNGLITGSTMGSLTDAVTYDGFGAPATFTATTAGSTLYAWSVTSRDGDGRITAATETLPAGTSHAWAFQYDPHGDLSSVTDGATTTQYSFDPNGNRSTVGAASSSYDAQDRLLSTPTTSYTYTNHGDLLTSAGSQGTTTYAYDLVGALRNVTLPTGDTVVYTVDGQGRRVGRTWTHGGQTVTQGYLYDDQLHIAAEVDATGNTVSTFVYGMKPNVPDAMVRGGTTYRILSDWRGSVRAVVDTSGNVVQTTDYDPWGVATVSDTTCASGAVCALFQPFGFAGGLYDRETTLVRFGSRDYDASVGRWTQKDGAGLTAGPNVYAYGGGDPVDFIDMNGHGALSCAVVGGLSEGIVQAAYEFSARAFNAAGNAFCGGDTGIDWGSVAAAGAMGAIGGALGAGSCFEAGTEVATCDDGLQPIETLREGDDVLSRNDETGENECRKVLRTFAHEADDVARLTLAAADGGERSFEVTLGHPFWVDGRGWTPVRELRSGDVLSTADGVAGLVVEGWVAEPGTARVFNLEVEGDHSYFVGADGVWVHNGCGPGTAAGAASTPQSAIALSKQLASEAQLGEMAAGAGRSIAGPGADAVFRDADRIANTYGGNAADWAKMSSSGFRAADGTTFATHWVENVVTGAQAEPKVVIDIFGGP
jgi:RHS repeat-associated protein